MKKKRKEDVLDIQTMEYFTLQTKGRKKRNGRINRLCGTWNEKKGRKCGHGWC